jgi:hypothetical protein
MKVEKVVHVREIKQRQWTKLEVIYSNEHYAY